MHTPQRPDEARTTRDSFAQKRPQVATVRAIRASPVARYGLAITVAAASIFFRLALDPVWGARLPFITLFPAVMVSAWLGGFWPGVVTTAISATAATYFWIEPLRSWRVTEPSELLGVFVFVAVGVVISALNETWRRGTATIAESEGRLSVTLASIGDAVITTDDRGVVTRVNPVAERLLGWSAAEAIGRSLADIFNIIVEHSRQPAPNPVDWVLREGVVSGLANHTLLVSRDGREIPIDDSAAPIRTEDGRMMGVVMVFRDISERRRTEREIDMMLERERETAAKAERLAGQLAQLQSVTDTALAGLDRESLIRELLARVRAVLGSDTATMLLLDADGTHLVPVASDGLQEELGGQIRIPLGQGVAGRIASTGKVAVIDDLTYVSVVSPVLSERVRSLVGAPLKVGDRLLGVVHAGSSTPRRFTDADASLLALAAERIALAIDSARLHEAERTAHAELEKVAEQLRVALEAGRMGTWQYTIATGQVLWSLGLEAIHGYAPGTFPGTFEAFRSEIHFADRERVLQAIAAAVDDRRDHHVEYRIVRTDGTVRWVEGRGQLFCDDAGRPQRMVGICADVTERKEAEERFRLAIEAAPTAMIMVDEKGRIVLANALTERLLGYERREIVGRSIEQLVPERFRGLHRRHRAGFLADARQRPMGAGRELFAARKDGSEVPVEIGLSPIETGNGTFVLAAVTDITGRKQLDEARAQLLVREQAARAEIERASRLKDEFLTMLSHELRTPLNAVLGYAHLLNTGILPPERSAHALSAIERNARAQARLVESLLDLSRIVAGKLELDSGVLNLHNVINAAADVIRPEAEAKDISIEIEAPSPDLSIMGDGNRLQQVFWNLLSNAIKFTPRGGSVGVRVTVLGGHAQIQVTDTGRGIPREFLPHVFERYQQAKPDRGRSTSGLGLGLTLVREIVHAHGGTVVADSPGEGQGSAFTVTLPSGGPFAGEQAEPTLPRRKVAESLQGIEILVVDDDSDVRDLLTLILESRGADVRTTSSAQDALDAIRRSRPDVVLADLRMPDEDGYALIRKIRAEAREAGHEHLPAIAVTAHAGAHDREQAIAAGYDGHVAKPIDPDDLIQAIAKVALVQM